MNQGIPDTGSLAVIAFYAAFVFGLIAALRKEAPKLDGRVIYVLAIAISILVSFLLAPDVHAYRSIAWFGLQIGGGAVALASGINYAAGKMAPPASPMTVVNQAISAAAGAELATLAKKAPLQLDPPNPATPTKPAA